LKCNFDYAYAETLPALVFVVFVGVGLFEYFDENCEYCDYWYLIFLNEIG
jgi:hypothetical protein